MNYLNTVTNWQFLNEPIYRWFIFFGALTAISVAWGSILAFMH